MKCEFKLVFDDYQYYPYVTSQLSDNKTMISRKNFLMKMNDVFKDKSHNFNHIAEMHIITIAQKNDMTSDFYIKHNMCALEGKLNAMINKNRSFINKFYRNWENSLNGKVESYRIQMNFINEYVLSFVYK